MKDTSVASSVGIVPEALTFDNYERWSVLMKNYLMGQDLWYFISEASSLEENSEAWKHSSNKKGKKFEATLDIEQVEREVSWKAKNAKALHIIQLSCGQQIQGELSGFELAREAWDYLSATYGKNLNIKLDRVHQDDNHLSVRHKMLLRMMKAGDSIEAIQGINWGDITSDSGETLLHIAVIAGNVKNVEILVSQGNKEFVTKKDTRGHTALALAACYNEKSDIVKCMVDDTESELGKTLLMTRNSDEEIPVLSAAANGHKEMTTYLYSKTPVEVFNNVSRILLLERCITAKIFDVALRLLILHPNLLIEYLHEESNKFSGLIALAKLCYSFPSRSRFNNAQQFIYDSLSVEKEFKGNYNIPDSDIANFVVSVTRGADRNLHNTSSAKCLSVRGFLTLAWTLMTLPQKLLGRLLSTIAYLLVQIFKCLNILGTKEMYDKKYTHYEVLGILKYFSQTIKEFNDLQLRQASAHEAMLYAAQNGIVEFINAMREANPDLLSVVDNSDRGIFWYAIQNRRQNVFQLIYFLNGLEKERFRYRTDAFGNNMLHVAALFNPSLNYNDRLNPTRQLQRELQWFQAVENVVHPKCKDAKNEDGKTPKEVFTESHKELAEAREKWTKDIARSYITVASLVFTIMFAAAFTAPRLNNQKNGKPILDDYAFTTFIIEDVVSIFFSSASVLVFIEIITLRYAEKDFLLILPLKLLSGFLLLTVSIVFMVLAFYSAFSIILEGDRIGTRQSGLVKIILPLVSIPIMVLLGSMLRFIYWIFLYTMKNTISSI